MTIAFGLLIRRFREAHGWSQADLASRVDGLLEFDIARIEWGDAPLASRTALESLAVALDLSPRMVLTASRWFAAQTAHLDLSSPSALANLSAEQLALIRDELVGWHDVQRELEEWIDDIDDWLDHAQADDA
jgi:transcriptional regulator with XRE-family HTH domain